MRREENDLLARLEVLAGRGGTVGAFFDLDHTVLHGSSGMLFTRYMWRNGMISTRQVLSILRVALMYYRGKTDFTASSRRMMSLIAGIPEEEMWRRCRKWFDEMVAGLITPIAQRYVAAHRSLGHQVALLSASTPFATVPAAELLGLEAGDAICTRLEVQEGILTGRVIEPMCYGEGKVYWAQRYARAKGIEMGSSFFYTDSHSDMPMLHQVGYPMAVNPNRRLRSCANEEGWPILRFY